MSLVLGIISSSEHRKHIEHMFYKTAGKFFEMSKNLQQWTVNCRYQESVTGLTSIDKASLHN